MNNPFNVTLSIADESDAVDLSHVDSQFLEEDVNEKCREHCFTQPVHERSIVQRIHQHDHLTNFPN